MSQIPEEQNKRDQKIIDGSEGLISEAELQKLFEQPRPHYKDFLALVAGATVTQLGIFLDNYLADGSADMTSESAVAGLIWLLVFFFQLDYLRQHPTLETKEKLQELIQSLISELEVDLGNDKNLAATQFGFLLTESRQLYFSLARTGQKTQSYVRRQILTFRRQLLETVFDFFDRNIFGVINNQRILSIFDPIMDDALFWRIDGQESDFVLLRIKEILNSFGKLYPSLSEEKKEIICRLNKTYSDYLYE